jgi:hypothetical protein
MDARYYTPEWLDDLLLTGAALFMRTDDAAIIVEASGEPGDIDTDGINFVLDDNTTVSSPPPQARLGLRRQVRKRRRANTHKDLLP